MLSCAKDLNVNASNFNVEKRRLVQYFFTQHCLPELADIVEWQMMRGFF